MSLRAVRNVYVVARSFDPTTYLPPDLPMTARSRVDATVIVALPGQYFIGRNTAVRSLIQPQAPLTLLDAAVLEDRLDGEVRLDDALVGDRPA